MGYPWFSPLLAKASSLLARNSLHHAMLCTTDGAFGIDSLAHDLAAMLLCEQPTDKACGQCKGCHLVAKNSHPDLLEVENDGSIIKIAAIREIIGQMVETSKLSGNRVVVLHGAERMNLSSANALLKILEEPPENTFFILTSEYAGQLLPTIRSRCLSMSLDAKAKEQVQPWLAQNGISEQCFLEARQQPLLAQELTSEAWQQSKAALIKALASGSPIQFAEQIKTVPLDHMVWWLQWWLENAIKQAMGAQNVPVEVVHSNNLPSLYALMDDLIDIRRKLTNHVNFNVQMLLEDLFIKMKPVLKV